MNNGNYMNPRIFGAALLGLGLTLTAYWYTHFLPAPAAEPTLVVVAGDRPSRGYITSKDQNNDGVPDWQEALRSTDPIEFDTLATSTYTTPETLTDQFAVDLFTNMINSKSFGEFGKTPDELIANANEELVASAKDVLYTTTDIVTSSNNSPSALRRYANQIAQISIDNGIPVETRNELLILEEAVQKNNPAVLSELQVIVDSYTGMIAATKEVSVPNSLRREHLNLLNTYQAILTDVQAMQQAFSDPLYTLLRVRRYQDDAAGLYVAFTNVFLEAYEAGARFENSDPTLVVVTITE